jgi:hypothetical protein
MTENEQIIIDTIEGLKYDLTSEGSLTVSTVRFEEIEVTEDVVEEMLDCSYIETTWGEGIFYHEPTQRFFFYGEPRSYSTGGRRWAVQFTEDMLCLIPPTLKELLIQVGTNGIPVTLPFDYLLDDTNK